MLFRSEIVAAGNGADTMSVGLPTGSGWVHVCVLLAPNQDRSRIFVNGSLARAGTLSFNSRVSSSLLQTGNVNGSPGNPFTGMLDDLALYNRELTEAEIQSLFAVKSPPVIQVNPASQSLLASATATFAVGLANLEGTSFQWRKDRSEERRVGKECRL